MDSRKALRFGDFEIDMRTGELHRKGLRTPLQDKPFEVLAALLERPGELVTRRELQERLWPPGTHVELEDGLNTAVSKLRQALGDTAQTPRFIATVPRHGYRFIAPCTPLSGAEPRTARSLLSVPPPRVLAWGVAALIVFVVLVWPRVIYQGREPAAPSVTGGLLEEVSPYSVAVLPFENLSSNPEDDYLSDGMTEELIGRLTKIERLTVVARRSVMRYKGSKDGARRIAEQLHVATVVEGSVRRDGDQIRITGQLIHGRSERSLWSETYQRELKDIFAVQIEVAEQIAAALEVELSVEEKSRIVVGSTSSFSAYDLYLRGLQYYLRFTGRDNESAITLFERALAEDPDFALASAGLADAYYSRATRYDHPRREWLAASLRQARRALEIDPNLAEAHKSMGLALAGQGLFQDSLQAFQRAIELRPGYAMAINNIGAVHEEMGQLDEALAWYERAVALNPVDPFFYTNIGGLYAVLGADETAFRWLERALELEPDSVHARVWLGALLMYRGEHKELLELAEEILAVSPDEPTGLSLAGASYWLMGRREEAEAAFRRSLHDGFFTRNDIALGQLLWDSGRRPEADQLLDGALDDLESRVAAGSHSSEHQMQIAEIHAIRGESVEAYRALERAAELEYPFARALPWNPCFAEMREDGRFRDLVSRIGRGVEEMRLRADERQRSGGSDPRASY